ncbi:MAG: hypothetical protein WCN98_10835 [Verrucomicrobiaceae bacterium]
MKIAQIRIHVMVATLLLGIAGLASAAPEAGSPESTDGKKSSVIWQNDPLCQFVFFAVLEGLYRDGVQNEVIDLLIGEPEKEKGAKIKSCFVFRCELCHATYEAFRAYRSRPVFQSADNQTTFGKGIDPSIIIKLKSEDAGTRVYAMGGLVRPWITRRIEETRKTDEEKKAMKKEFERFATDGGKMLDKHKADKDPLYLDWNFYGTCQACEAAKDLGVQK